MEPFNLLSTSVQMHVLPSRFLFTVNLLCFFQYTFQSPRRKGVRSLFYILTVLALSSP